MHTIAIIDSGGGFPVSGSILCMLIIFRINGSLPIVIKPVNVSHVIYEQLDQLTPDPNSCVSQTGKPRSPASQFAENNGIGDKAKVHDAVDQGDVNIPENTVLVSWRFASRRSNSPDWFKYAH